MKRVCENCGYLTVTTGYYKDRPYCSNPVSPHSGRNVLNTDSCDKHRTPDEKASVSIRCSGIDCAKSAIPLATRAQLKFALAEELNAAAPRKTLVKMIERQIRKLEKTYEWMDREKRRLA